MSKFHILCSCVICNRELTVQSLTEHHASHAPKKQCKFCNLPIYTNSKSFCNSSCSAKYNNTLRSVETRRKQGPPKGTKPKNYYPYTKVKWCMICANTFVPRSHSKVHTCSSDCRSKLLSRRAAEKISKGWNPNSNRGRGKRSYLERSFEEWLHLNHYTDFETEKHFRNHALQKSYFVDFYFPTLEMIIELDGSQHNHPQQQKADAIRDDYLSTHYGITVVRVSHKEYKDKTKMDEIGALLGIRIPTSAVEAQCATIKH